MKVLFAHDHKFYRFDNQFFSNGSFTETVLKRYKNEFGEMSIVSRQIHLDKQPKDLSYSGDRDSFEFIEVPDFKSISKMHLKIKAQDIIEAAVKECDYLVARSSEVALIAIKYARKHNKPYLLEVVGCPWDSLWNYSLLGKALAPKAYLKLRKHAKQAPYVIYVTKYFLQDRYPTNGKSINISNVELKHFDDSIIEFRKKQFNAIDNRKLILGTTAALDVPFKGQKYVIKALANLKKQGLDNFDYQLVGKGSSLKLEKLVEKYSLEDNVKIIGSLKHSEVFEWLKKLDIYIQPSKQEGLPRAVLEAMNQALPVLGANTGGIPELIDVKAIFNKKPFMHKNIQNKLKLVTKQFLLTESKTNYSVSKKYKKLLLDEKRVNFLNEFKRKFY